MEFLVFGGELGEIFSGFGEHDVLFGADGIFRGVEAGLGFSRDGDWASDFWPLAWAGCALAGIRKRGGQAVSINQDGLPCRAKVREEGGLRRSVYLTNSVLSVVAAIRALDFLFRPYTCAHYR